MRKILIADDHAVVRKGLITIASESLIGVYFDEASNGHEVLEKIRKNKYEVVVLDISLPDISGLDVLKQSKIDNPGLPILILSIHPEDQYAVRLLRAGAAGYLTKDSAPDELVSAISKVMQGGRYVSAALAEKLVLDLDSGVGKPPHEGLSDREYQVMRLIASGKTVKEIAETLSLSVKTISTYRSRVMQKMKMKNNAELMRYAITNRLAD